MKGTIDMTDALTLTGVSKTYAGSDFALKDVSFSLPAGSIMGLVGANGAGKSTTIGCILGTLKPQFGNIRVFGREISDDDTALRDAVGVVYDGDNFPGYLTASQLSYILRDVYSQWDDALFQELLTRFHLDDRKKISRYSKGMTMTLAIAAALAHHPTLLILDEATSGLDPLVREEVLDLLLDFVGDETRAVLLSSHITSDLAQIADRLTFLHEGRVILSEEKDALLYDYGILRCRKAQFATLDATDILAYKQEAYQISVLVADRERMARKYPDVTMDRADIDEILRLLVKGVRDERIIA